MTRSRILGQVALCIGLIVQPALADSASEIVPGKLRLSEALSRSSYVWPAVQGHVQWRREANLISQRARKQALLMLMRERARHAPGRERVEAFLAWWERQPVTGAEWLPEQDPAVLALHPELDPWLAPGDEVRVLPLASSVAVLDGGGAPCAAAYLPRATLRDYVAVCADHATRDEVWLINPGQRPRRIGIASWNADEDPFVMPGAWVLSPPALLNAADQLALVDAIATLGPFREAIATRIPQLVSPPARDLLPTSGDFGGIGLMQTPTARFRPAGEVAATLSYVDPYFRYNISLQPLDWLEAGLRYTDIRNRPYGPDDFSGSQSYKDKSIDARFRLSRETASMPQLALGLRDIGGTSFFGSEYLVASKRFERLDFSLGLGWGNMASRGGLPNPLTFLFGDSYDRRDVSFTPGAVNNSYFKGPTNLFGGVEWHLVDHPVTIKAEYDANSYRAEPLGNRFDVVLPINLGVNYRFGQNLEAQVAIERGNALSLGLTYHGDLSRLATEKTKDPAPVSVVRERPVTQRGSWQEIARGIQNQAGTEVLEISKAGPELHVTLAPPGSIYAASRFERAGRVLHAAADEQIRWFDFKVRNLGLPITQVVVDRDALAKRATAWEPEAERAPVLAAERPTPAPANAEVVYRKEPSTSAYRLGLDYGQTLGGPDGFLLFQIDAVASGRFNFSPDTWAYGVARGRLYDNYQDFKFDAPSGLPRVRTDTRRYLTESPIQLTNLQLTKVSDIGDDMFVMFYGGYLERMFAGLGAEWLMRPPGSPLALGVDVNRVRQRDFDEGFGLRDYTVTTGHVSLYVDTGIQDILAVLKLGRYLAGDLGVTADFSRIFRNGVVMGAYATLTSASRAEYGEGSFSKGMYLSVPFDALFERSSRNASTFNWTPLTRDGGAILARPFGLYGLTDMRQPRTLGLMPPRN